LDNRGNAEYGLPACSKISEIDERLKKLREQERLSLE